MTTLEILLKWEKTMEEHMAEVKKMIDHEMRVMEIGDHMTTLEILLKWEKTMEEHMAEVERMIDHEMRVREIQHKMEAGEDEEHSGI